MSKKSPSAIEELRVALEELGLNSSGSKDKLRRRYKFREQRLEEKKKQQQWNLYSLDNQAKIPLRYLLIVDVEATCEEGCGFTFDNEIIEFPCLLYDLEKNEVIDEFHSYVRPNMNPTLSDYCISLTGIQQSVIDQAPPFLQVLENLTEFLRQHRAILQPPIDEIKILEPSRAIPRSQLKNWAWTCDGPWDMASFIAKQFKFSNTQIPDWIKGHFVDLRAYFSDVYHVPRINIEGMLQRWNLRFEGNQHSGIDDSRNIARIINRMSMEGITFECNRWWLKYENNGWIPNRKYPPFLSKRQK
ncbi:double-strand siRNA ribonuclease Eri1 [Schizosaccharomyces osmophilus]|uniref:Double-strand siRNA ribonuclease Eri1 n=1 Tax=Schizosaccharomyces osmophilus TaxID=2545709 RepID=A0AAE9W6M8_9SCHI|nr:double-strand siRNA ribonuclease Eri1 [Schizosaccharomyces osmophilus]WBW70976.1 double-strand siRNA ribonuclease Eri1 [Schizosaccharomyces osmophilus]